MSRDLPGQLQLGITVESESDVVFFSFPLPLVSQDVYFVISTRDSRPELYYGAWQGRSRTNLQFLSLDRQDRGIILESLTNHTRCPPALGHWIPLCI